MVLYGLLKILRFHTIFYFRHILHNFKQEKHYAECQDPEKKLKDTTVQYKLWLRHILGCTL